MAGGGGGFAGGGFWPEVGFGRRLVLVGGGFRSEGGFGRRGVLVGEGFFYGGAFCPILMTTKVATPNINCILVSTL